MNINNLHDSPDPLIAGTVSATTVTAINTSTTATPMGFSINPNPHSTPQQQQHQQHPQPNHEHHQLQTPQTHHEHQQQLQLQLQHQQQHRQQHQQQHQQQQHHHQPDTVLAGPPNAHTNIIPLALSPHMDPTAVVGTGVTATAAANANATATTSTTGASVSTTNPHILPTASTAKNKGSNNNNNVQGGGDFRGGQEHWNAMLFNLALYKSKYGDANVKYNHNDPRDHGLYIWLTHQRKHFRAYCENKPSFMNEDRVAVLETIGVTWNVRGEVFWTKMYKDLKQYKLEKGNTIVPRKFPENKKLGEWVTDQRRQYKHKAAGRSSLLSDERERKLNEIGFVWSLRNRTDWNERFQQLVRFKEAEGHCVVPQMYSLNKALGKWVSKQREQYRLYLQNKPSFMTEERIAMLNDIGFAWSVKGRKTSEIEELQHAYKGKDNDQQLIVNSTPSPAVQVVDVNAAATAANVAAAAAAASANVAAAAAATSVTLNIPPPVPMTNVGSVIPPAPLNVGDAIPPDSTSPHNTVEFTAGGEGGNLVTNEVIHPGFGIPDVRDDGIDI